jgi:DNA (cytosine-5)-methyltransferase 1
MQPETAVEFGSVCSGIEAASVAWHPLGWRAAWLAEIEAFPRSVLAHHYPNVPNLGDMRTIVRRVLTREITAPDVLTGGTPCQAFSLAGLRNSLDDERGNLTLTFVRIADAIDFIRARDGKPACVIKWENVPGVLSTKDNAFGCFLAGLAGEDAPLQPAGKRWSDAGCVYGPRRAIAWRTLDAQYFGLAQRRRRVFVVASARAGFDPATVLFEWQGVRRDSAPSRKAGKRAAATLDARTDGGGFPGTDGACGGHVVPVAPTLTAQYGEQCGQDYMNGLAVAHAFDARQSDVIQYGDKTGPLDTDGSSIAVLSTFATQAGALRRENPASGPDGVGVQADHAYTLEARSEVQAVALRGREGGATVELGGDAANALRASGGGGDKAHVLAAMQVRRLTPRECERLQGFPDDYTLVPHRGKPAADGPRYKALGNSWAVPVARWIGSRIHQEIAK